MFIRVLSISAAALMLAGCPTANKKAKKAQGPEVKMKDQNGDMAFQSFTGRLRKAVEARDRVTLATMMAPDFGYRWDNPPPGETPFTYWDKHKLWGQLASVVNDRWTPHEAFMVAPPAFAQSESYPGYRAGATVVNGSWRFAYFVPAPPPGDAPQEQPAESPLPPLPE